MNQIIVTNFNTYYRFIYNQTRQCIKEENKLNDIYYDEEDDTYKNVMKNVLHVKNQEV